MRASLLLLLFCLLASCSSAPTTVVEHADAARVKGLRRISVVYVTSDQVNFGSTIPEASDPAQTWGIVAAVHDAIEAGFRSVGKEIESFKVITAENGFLSKRGPIPNAAEAVLVVSEGDLWDVENHLRFTGIGMILQARDAPKTDLIQPYALFDLALTFRNGSEPIHAASGPYAGPYGQKGADHVPGVVLPEKLGDFTLRDRAILRPALQEEVQSVLHSLLEGLSLASASGVAHDGQRAR